MPVAGQHGDGPRRLLGAIILLTFDLAAFREGRWALLIPRAIPAVYSIDCWTAKENQELGSH